MNFKILMYFQDQELEYEVFKTPVFFEKQEVKLILTNKKLLISNINTTFKKLEYNDIDSNNLKFTYKKNSNPDRYDIAKLCIRDTKKTNSN